jgi:hypothetical protein
MRWLDATADQVERAIASRAADVVATVLDGVGDRGRLMDLRKAGDPPVSMTKEEMRTYLFKRWDDVLKGLA